MSIPVIDTHQHLWDPETLRYSWMDGFPAIRRRAMMEEYREATAGLGIVETVYVDTDVDEVDQEREIATIFGLADDPANRIGGIVAGAKLEKAGALDHLERWAKHPKLKGIRRVLHTQPDDLSQQPQFWENLQAVGERGWSFDLCVLPRQLPRATELAGKFPEVSFILDHCGVPDIKAGALEPWRTNLRELAQRPNVACKVSGLVAYADPEKWTVQDLQPFFAEALEGFGWDRVMWGGDWPVCTLSASLKAWLEAARKLTEGATAEQRRQFFEGNARRIYRLGQG